MLCRLVLQYVECSFLWATAAESLVRTHPVTSEEVACVLFFFLSTSSFWEKKHVSDNKQRRGKLLRRNTICEHKKMRQDDTEHWPSSLVVKEEDQEQVLPGLLGHLLPQFQHIQRGDRDWDSPVEHPLPGHLRVNYLQAKGRSHMQPLTCRMYWQTLVLCYLQSPLVSHQSRIRRIASALCPHQVQSFQRRIVIRGHPTSWPGPATHHWQ